MSELKRLADHIRGIVRSKAKGSALESAVLALGLDDPEAKLCVEAGADDTGRIRCSLCRLSGGQQAGCMKLIEPIQNALAQRNSPRVKMKLELLAQQLDAISEDTTALHGVRPDQDD